MMNSNSTFSVVVFCIICSLLLLEGVSSFSFHAISSTKQLLQTSNIKNNIILQSKPRQLTDLNDEGSDSLKMVIESDSDDDKKTLRQSLIAGCITFVTTTTPLSAFAAEALDELEIEELPPVYVPILFAIGVLGGVGVLTASLGNVMDEGTFLLMIIREEMDTPVSVSYLSYLF